MTPANWPAYGSYKESGIEWIGSVPAAWSVERGKWLFVKKDRPTRLEDEVVTCFRDGQVTLRRNRRTDGFTNALKEHGYQGIRKGDLVIHAMDAFAGAIGVSDSDGKATPVYSACVPRQPGTVDPHFYAYYMRHLALSGLLVSLAKGIRERSTDFRYGDFADLQLVAPPLAEQRAISAFLDEKCAKVDEAVRIKEEQIALLRERRQILIQEAVTRGLNPDAPMKDSGIDWIGMVPAHWEVKPCRYAFRSVRRSDRDGTEIKLSVTQKRGLVPTDEMEESSTQASDFGEFQICHPGDLVLNKYKAHLGVFWTSPVRGIITNNYTVFRPLRAIVSKYFEVLFHTAPYISVFARTVYGVTEGMAPLYTGDFYLLPAICPPEDEQKKMLEHLTTLAARFDRAIAIKKSQIAVLREYKTTLINAAVTGKIKVA